MSPLARFLWIVAGIVFCAIVYVNRPGKDVPAAEAFLKVFRLTPAEIKAHCGSPDADVIGVLSSDHGIRDLYYHGMYNSTIVFRFISDDSSTWDSLGAWAEPTESDKLDVPFDSAKTFELMPCVGKVSSASTSGTSTLTLTMPETRFAGLNLAFVQMQHIEPPVRIDPLPRIDPLTRIDPVPNIDPLPRIDPLTSDPGPVRGTGGEGDPPDTHGTLTTMVIPCPPDADPCEVIDALKFIADLRQAVAAGKENDFVRVNNWLNRLKGKNNVIVQLPALQPERDAAIKEIFHLEAQTINSVFARLRADLRRLQPLQSDSSVDKERKLDVVMQEEQQRREMWKTAVEEARNSTNPSSDSSSRTSSMRFQSNAYKQAVQIHLSGSWGSN